MSAMRVTPRCRPVAGPAKRQAGCGILGSGKPAVNDTRAPRSPS
jgi:hypothetical protein